MADIKCYWSGGGYCHCFGEWSIFIDGVNYSEFIPFKTKPANTYKLYEANYLDDDMNEIHEEYSDGLLKHDWIRQNSDWLHMLPLSHDEFGEVYDAFNESDWRYQQCGGCI